MDHYSLTEKRIAHHRLRIGEPVRSLAFYRQVLGMRLFAERQDGTAVHYLLGYAEGESKLELVYRPDQPPIENLKSAENLVGYWKIGLTLADVDLARQRLIGAGVDVSVPRQFRDIGYLCHLTDPDGYVIELLQQTFEANYRPFVPQPAYPLGCPATLAHITLRVKDAEQSLRFYQDRLGMRLLSRQVVEPYRFTLYFLAYTAESPPHEDLDAVENREWLWRRPYTVLELQHSWDMEQEDLVYLTDEGTGFCGLSIAVPDLDGETAVLFDPDLYPVNLIDSTCE